MVSYTGLQTYDMCAWDGMYDNLSGTGNISIWYHVDNNISFCDDK